MLASTGAQDIVFPDVQNSTSGQYNLSIPTSSEYKVKDLLKFIPVGCGDSDYCEDSPDYPDAESVKEIVRNFGNPDLAQILFTQIGAAVEEDAEDGSGENHDSVATFIIAGKTQPQQPPVEYNLISLTPLCHTIDNYVFPKTAKTRSSQWR